MLTFTRMGFHCSDSEWSSQSAIGPRNHASTASLMRPCQTALTNARCPGAPDRHIRQRARRCRRLENSEALRTQPRAKSYRNLLLLRYLLRLFLEVHRALLRHRIASGLTILLASLPRQRCPCLGQSRMCSPFTENRQAFSRYRDQLITIELCDAIGTREATMIDWFRSKPKAPGIEVRVRDR